MSLGSFLKKVNKVTNKVQKFSAKVSTVDRALKSVARVTGAGSTSNKSRAPAKRGGA